MGFMNFNMYIQCMWHLLKLLIVWKIQIQIQLASTSTPGTSGYMAPEILLKRASTKSDVYSFGVLLIQLVNGSPFILDGNEVHIRKFIQWAQKVHVEENGFQQIFDVVINNSIIGFDHNEAKSFLQISLQCIKVIFVPNLLCVSFNLLSSKFEKPKSWIRCSTWNNLKYIKLDCPLNVELPDKVYTWKWYIQFHLEFF